MTLSAKTSLMLEVHKAGFRREGHNYYVKFEKVRMDYSCHGRYKDIHVVFSLFSLLSS